MGRGRQLAPLTAPRGEVGGVFCPRALAAAMAATAHSGGATAGGVWYPKAPSQIAREGFLIKGTPPLTWIISLLQAHGGAPRATSSQLGGRGLQYR